VPAFGQCTPGLNMQLIVINFGSAYITLPPSSEPYIIRTNKKIHFFGHGSCYGLEHSGFLLFAFQKFHKCCRKIVNSFVMFANSFILLHMGFDCGFEYFNITMSVLAYWFSGDFILVLIWLGMTVQIH